VGGANGFAVDATEDPSAFTPANLARYKAVVFLNPSGNVLDASRRSALRKYIQKGNGFVGIHNATAFVLEDWTWYTNLVGARYESEIGTQPLVLRVVNKTHPSTRGLPATTKMTEEAYNFDVNPKTRGVTVLINLDEQASGAGSMGQDHPFSWFHHYDGGRSWHTTGGANDADYDNPLFRRHLLGGIRWAGSF
jgi:type 1 glutamine amidotransferase